MPFALAACTSGNNGTDSGGGNQDLAQNGNQDLSMSGNHDMLQSGQDMAQGGPQDLAQSGPQDLAGDMAGNTGTMVDLTGTFATKIVNYQIFNSSLNGTGPVTITTLFLTAATQAGTTLTTQATTCDVKLSPYKGSTETVNTTYPPSAIKAIHPQSSTIALGTAKVGDAYAFQAVQNIGWKPSGDPKTTPLPTKATDPQVTDDDMDGHPGVTLQVMATGAFPISGNVYACNRSIVDVNAKILSKDKVAGPSATTQAQQVLGSDNNLLAGQQVTSTQDPNKQSTFTMVRLTAAQQTCAYIVANQGTLFP